MIIKAEFLNCNLRLNILNKIVLKDKLENWFDMQRPKEDQFLHMLGEYARIESLLTSDLNQHSELMDVDGMFKYVLQQQLQLQQEADMIPLTKNKFVKVSTKIRNNTTTSSRVCKQTIIGTFVNVNVVFEILWTFTVNGTFGNAQVTGLIQFGVARTALARYESKQSEDDGKEPGELHDD
ncbi:hypothetical protein FF38_00339 [Lucilia cuprina]|uniref:Uncharacterized protein n=1 Tax=Lucilia cuprina TaxID=7375 RepID=A0A0L0CB39_LUCCU|nr:hypothetical protein FF38_00339 [Lucilia cuprina]